MILFLLLPQHRVKAGFPASGALLPWTKDYDAHASRGVNTAGPGSGPGHKKNRLSSHSPQETSGGSIHKTPLIRKTGKIP
jgi:hypothetical protein